MNRYKRLTEELKRDNIDIAVYTTPANVTYSTGFEIPYYKTYMESISEDSVMAIAVVSPYGRVRRLLASSFYRQKAEKTEGLDDVVYFTNYDAFGPFDPFRGVVECLKSTLKELIGADRNCTLGIERNTCSSAIADMIRAEFPEAKIVDARRAIIASRQIKTPEEIIYLRHAAEVMDVAQNTLKKIAQSEGEAEYTEYDIWAEVTAKMNIFADKELLPFVGELVTGPATALSDYPLGPRGRIVSRGDAGIMDVCPRVSGYWADTTNSVVFYAERNSEQEKYYLGVYDAFCAALEALVPGNRCCDAEMAHRKAFEKHGMKPVAYLGHEIGLEVNETPRLTCYDETVIKPGMVFCIEPQQYAGAAGETGVRLEKMILIREDGPEVLNHFTFGTF